MMTFNLDHPNESTKIGRAIKFVMSNYRFVVAFIYSIAAGLNVSMLNTFTSLENVWISYYGATDSFLNWITIIICIISFLPANIIANYIVERYGLRIGIILGSLLNLIGLWLICLMNQSFNWVFVSQIFAGFAQPYFYLTILKITSIWFKPSERALAMGFMIGAFPVGTFLGSHPPQWFIENIPNNLSVQDQLQNFMVLSAILGSVGFIATVILVKEKPLDPPSKAASLERYGIIESLTNLLKDLNIMVMLTSSAVVTVTTGFAYLTMPNFVVFFSLDSTQFKYTEIIGLFLGLGGITLGVAFIEKMKTYKYLIPGFSLFAILFYLISFLTAQSQSEIAFSIFVVAFRIATGPIMLISFEYVVDLAFPCSEGIVGGVWFAIDQIFVMIQSIITSSIIESSEEPSNVAKSLFIFFLVFLIMATIPLIFVQEQLKRTEYENNTNLLNEESPKQIEREQNYQDTSL